MRKIFLLTTLFYFGLNVFAERNITELKIDKWYFGSTVPSSVAEFQNSISNFQLCNDSSFLQQKNEKRIICSVIDLSAIPTGKLIISMNQGNSYFNVWINGEKMVNKLENENILYEFDYLSETGKILLSLEIKPDTKIDATNFQSILKNIKITTLSGIFISEALPQKDQYFGCPMLEIHVWNFLGKDIDGKLYARIKNFDNQELMAENNNCAFSRNGLETIIEVIFPEIKTAFIGKHSVEIELVDKENNEEIIDQLLVPVSFK
jgi:hypothetical protein